MRLFLALSPPESAIEQIVAWQRANQPEGVFPEPASNLHMTLAFLGEQPDELIPAFRDAINASWNEMTISGAIEYRELDRLSMLVFADQGGQEMWEKLNGHLKELIGFEPQFRPWLPHFTIWRFSERPNLQPTELPQITFMPVGAHVYTSVKNPAGGGIYTPIAHVNRTANIFDSIEPELDQQVFDGITLKNRHINFIRKLYMRAFLSRYPRVDFDRAFQLNLTGSLTTYQYGETSDADISVFADFDYLWEETGLDPDTMRKELISLSIEHIDGTFLPGTTHPLQFFVVAKGILPEDLYQPGLRSAFDLETKQWIVEPEPDRVHNIAEELPNEYSRASAIAEKLSDMLDHDPEQARAVWRDVHKKRQLDQRAGLGDFSEGNIVYKYLLHEGLFERIRNELGEYIAKTAGELEDFVIQQIDSNEMYVKRVNQIVDGGEKDPMMGLYKFYTDVILQTPEFETWKVDWDEIVAHYQRRLMQNFGPLHVRGDPAPEYPGEESGWIKEEWDNFFEDVYTPIVDSEGVPFGKGDYVYYTLIDTDGDIWGPLPVVDVDEKRGFFWVDFPTIPDQEPQRYWDFEAPIFTRVDTLMPAGLAKVAMPPAEEWPQFAEGIRGQESTGRLVVQNPLGLRWSLNIPVLEQVASLFGEILSINVPSGYFEGYGALNYQYVPTLGVFNYRITLNPYLSPEAATYSLWHEIQHAFQLQEGRAKPSVGQQPFLEWDSYINDPDEIDADNMAAAMQKLQDLPLVIEMDVRDGIENEYYDDLMAEGYTDEEAIDLIDPENSEIDLATLIERRKRGAIELPTGDAEFPIPPKVLDYYKRMATCPRCESQMLRDDLGDLLCPTCGYQFTEDALDYINPWDNDGFGGDAWETWDNQHGFAEGVGFYGKTAKPLMFQQDEFGFPVQTWEGEITILYADMKGFTAFCEKNHPSVVAEVINRCVTTALVHIRGQGGYPTLVGDAIMATFSRPGHAQAAVDAAIAMQRDVYEMVWRVGINTGLVSMGMQVLGDAVNVAARLESMSVPGHILCSEETFNQSEKTFPADYVGQITVKGRERPIRAYHIEIGPRDPDSILEEVMDAAYPPDPFLGKKSAVGDGDGWIEHSDGILRWGQNGAAGILFVTPPDVLGQRQYLLTHRGEGVDQGGTWSIPGGAIDSHETPFDGAWREVDEELGEMPTQYTILKEDVYQPVPEWAYTTFVVEVPEAFEAGLRDWETQDTRWFGPEEMQSVALHPAFQLTWDSGRLTKTAGTTMYHVSPSFDREKIKAVGLDYSVGEHSVTPREEWQGNYLWDTFHNADRYAEMLMEWDERDSAGLADAHPLDTFVMKNLNPVQWVRMNDDSWANYDIWKVNLPTDVQPKLDPYFEVQRGPGQGDQVYDKQDWAHPEQGTPGAWRIDAPIPPENLTLYKVKRIQDWYDQPEPMGDSYSPGYYGASPKPLDALWDERVTTKVIYDFDADRIVLGTMADAQALSHSKIMGEYADNIVTLFEAEKQWINPTYFRKLWYHSFPEKQLKDVYYKRGDEPSYKLKSLPRGRHGQHA